MDKYGRLLSNTFIFAIGTFSSKVLVFLLMPFYTRVLSTAELGVGDLIVKTANLIIPIASVGMSNAIIRFGLDRAVDKRDVFTGGITAIACGYAVFLAAFPVLSVFGVLEDGGWLIYPYVLTSCLRSLCSQFVRSRQLVKLYAFDGVMSTVNVILFNIIFLIVFDMGFTGYVLATVCSDLVSALFLFTIASLHRYIRFSCCDWSVLGAMVRYAVPLIPTTVFWWITNASDAYFIKYYIGAEANGLLTIAYKIPTIITLLSGIFTDAWQMSAFTEDGPGRTRFFSNVFNAYQSLIFAAASGLILLCKPLNYLLAYGEFYKSWEYIPFLLLGTCFSCYVTFLGSIYMLERKSIATLVTTAAGAGINILLNMLLIPRFGVNGGTFATFASYLLVFFIRIIDTHKIVPIRWKPWKLFLNLAVLLVQSWVLITVEKGWVVWEAGLCLLLVLINLRQLLLNAQKILLRRVRHA